MSLNNYSSEDVKFEFTRRVVGNLILNGKDRDSFTFMVDCGDVEYIPVSFQYQLSRESVDDIK